MRMVPQPVVTPINRYLREREAAKFLGVSQHTLRAWRTRGSPTGLPYARFGRVLVYSSKELERFMEERTHRGSMNH
jgi:transposase